MDSSQLPLFALADRRLAWLDRRQELLAQNIANANTPGYRARDLPAFDTTLKGALAAGGSGLGPVQTDPRHLAGTLPVAAARGDVLQGERSPDGNSVSLDDQLARVADTDSTHELVTGLYKKYIGLFRIALGH